MATAYVVAITKENMPVIRSEAGPGFIPEDALQWLEDHGVGWFLRDESSPLDCQFFEHEVLVEMYYFRDNDHGQLFRPVVKL